VLLNKEADRTFSNESIKYTETIRLERQISNNTRCLLNDGSGETETQYVLFCLSFLGSWLKQVITRESVDISLR